MPVVTRKDYEGESKRQDALSISKAIDHLEYLIFPNQNKVLVWAFIRNDDYKQGPSKFHATEFSKYISALSIKNDSITDSHKNIPWDLLRNLHKIIGTEQECEFLEDDLRIIFKALIDLSEKENFDDLDLDIPDMIGEYGMPQARFVKKKRTVEMVYEDILFQDVPRNNYNDLLLLTLMEKKLYKIYVDDAKNKLSDLIKNLELLDKNLKNNEAILAITALAGEISKNILIFERYIPKEDREILKNIKRLRDSIEHMVDYEESSQYFTAKKSDANFINELVKISQDVVAVIEGLPENAIRQQDAVSNALENRADKAIAAIKKSLPESLDGNIIIDQKLVFIRRAIIGEFEFRRLGDNFQKAFSDNLIKLLKHDCEELKDWSGVEEGMKANLKLRTDQIKFQNKPEVKKEVNRLFRILSDNSSEINDFEELSYQDKYEILSKYSERSFLEKDFSKLFKKVNAVKGEISKVNQEISVALKDFQKLTSFNNKTKTPPVATSEIDLFIQKYKELEKQYGKRTSSLEKQFEIITESLVRINKLTEDLLKESKEKNLLVKDLANSDKLYHYAILFNLTIIGQAIQNLRGNDQFVRHGSFELKREFENLRKVRNSIAHDQHIDEAGSVLSYYSNDFTFRPIQLDGARAYDSTKYLESIDSLITQTIDAIAQDVGSASLSVDEKDGHEEEYQKYLLKELLQKAIDLGDKDSCLSILCTINANLDDQETKIGLAYTRYINDLRVRNYWFHGLEFSYKTIGDLEDLDVCKEFLERNNVDTDKECKNFGDFKILAHELLLKKCKSYLTKLGINQSNCKHPKDFFNLAQKEFLHYIERRNDNNNLEKRFKDKMKELSKSKEPDAFNDDLELQEILNNLGINVQAEYGFADYYAETIKAKLYQEDEFYYLEEIIAAQIRADRDFVVQKIKEFSKYLNPISDANIYLGKLPTLDVRDLCEKRSKIEEICNKHNVTINGISGDILKYSRSRVQDKATFLIEADNIHNIAEFKKDFCELMGMKLKIVTSLDLQEYLNQEERGDEFDQELEKLQKVNLSQLQNGYQLYELVQDRNIEKVESFLQENEGDIFFDINVYGYTPLQSACSQFARALDVGRSLEIVDMLLKAGSNPNIQDKHGNNMLHNAAQDGDMELIKIALDNKVSTESENRHGETALEMRLYCDNADEVRAFLFDRTNLSPEKKIVAAIRAGNVDHVRELLSQIDVNQKFEEGDYLLNIACDSFQYPRENKLEIVNLLIESGVNINVKNERGLNAIDSVLEENDDDTYEILELLISKKVEISNSALRSSIHHEVKVVQLLIDNGANPNKPDRYNNYASLEMANWANTSNPKSEVIKKLQILCDAGLDLYLENDAVGNILHQGVERGHKNIVEFLLNRGIDAGVISSASSYGGKTAHEIAIKMENYEIAQMIKNYNEMGGAQDEEKQSSPSPSPIPDTQSIESLSLEEKDSVPNL